MGHKSEKKAYQPKHIALAIGFGALQIWAWISLSWHGYSLIPFLIICLSVVSEIYLLVHSKKGREL